MTSDSKGARELVAWLMRSRAVALAIVCYSSLAFMLKPLHSLATSLNLRPVTWPAAELHLVRLSMSTHIKDHEE